jgi:hypothetical protein
MTKHYEKNIVYLSSGKIKFANIRPNDLFVEQAIESAKAVNQEGVKFRDMYVDANGKIAALNFHDGKAAEIMLPPIVNTESWDVETNPYKASIVVQNQRTLKGNRGARVQHNRVAGVDQNDNLIIDNTIFAASGSMAGLDCFEVMVSYETEGKKGYEPKATYDAAILKQDGSIVAYNGAAWVEIAEHSPMYPVDYVSGLRDKPFTLTRNGILKFNGEVIEGTYRYLSRPMLYSLPRYVSRNTYAQWLAMKAEYEAYPQNPDHPYPQDIYETLGLDWANQWTFYYPAFPIVLVQRLTTLEIIALDAETGEDITLNSVDPATLYDNIYYKPTSDPTPKKVIIPPMPNEKMREVNYYGEGLFVGLFGENDPVDVSGIIKNGGVASGGIADETVKPLR